MTSMTSILLLLPLISWVCSQDTTFTIVDDVPDINSIQSPDAVNDVTVTIDATDDVTTTQDTTSASRDNVRLILCNYILLYIYIQRYLNPVSILCLWNNLFFMPK